MRALSVLSLKQKRDPLQSPPWKYPWACRPITRDDIAKALESSVLETRGGRSNELWSVEEHADRENHVLRIAYLVKHRDDEPVRLDPKTGGVFKGWHRD